MAIFFKKKGDVNLNGETNIRADTRTTMYTNLCTNNHTDTHTYASANLRIGKVLCRARQIQRVNESHLAFGLSLACFMVGCGLVGSVSLTADGMPQVGGVVTGGYGTVMLHSSASIFVLVALLAFVTGVAITAICVRGLHKKTYKNKQKIKEKNK